MRIAIFAFFVSISGLANLPDDVIAQVEAMRPALQELSDTLLPGQRELFLERYVDLVLESPFTLGFDLDKKTLLEHVKTRLFFRKVAEEADLKRSKRLVVQTQTATNFLDRLVKAFAGSVRGRIIDLNIDCGAKSYELPFQIEDSKEVLELSLAGVPMPHPEDPSPERDCLDLRIHYKASVVSIRALNSKHAACPLPAQRAGSCLLGAAEQIARALEKRRLTLIDGSQIKCSKDRKEVSLRRLKTYQEGQGWYEKNGFLPIRDVEDFLARRKTFFDYPLATLQKGLALSKEYYHTIPVRDLLQKRIKSYLAQTESRNATAAQFMAWLWENDCPAYGAIDDYLSKTSNGLAFTKLYPADSSFVKELR